MALAHVHIDAIAEAGADVVEFQTHIAAAESTPSRPTPAAHTEPTDQASTPPSGRATE